MTAHCRCPPAALPGCLNGGGQVRPAKGETPQQLIERLEVAYHAEGGGLEPQRPQDSPEAQQVGACACACIAVCANRLPRGASPYCSALPAAAHHPALLPTASRWLAAVGVCGGGARRRGLSGSDGALPHAVPQAGEERDGYPGRLVAAGAAPGAAAGRSCSEAFVQRARPVPAKSH